MPGAVSAGWPGRPDSARRGRGEPREGAPGERGVGGGGCGFRAGEGKSRGWAEKAREIPILNGPLAAASPAGALPPSPPVCHTPPPLTLGESRAAAGSRGGAGGPGRAQVGTSG